MTDLFSIAGKTALVTGGSRGIGAMIATGYVEAGAKVYVSSRKAEACEAVAAELSQSGLRALPGRPVDRAGLPGAGQRPLAERGSACTSWSTTPATPGGHRSRSSTTPPGTVCSSLNVKGVFHTTKFLTPLLRAAVGADDPARVINIGSIDGIHVPVLETYSYSASKAAVHQLTRAPGKRLAPEITVNAIAPGPFESKMMAATLETFGEQIAAGAPLKRIGRPDDMAGAAIFLASRAGRLPHRCRHPRRRWHRHRRKLSRRHGERRLRCD